MDAQGDGIRVVGNESDDTSAEVRLPVRLLAKRVRKLKRLRRYSQHRTRKKGKDTDEKDNEIILRYKPTHGCYRGNRQHMWSLALVVVVIGFRSNARNSMGRDEERCQP